MHDDALVVAKPLNRSSIGARQNLKKKPDGSINLIIRQDSPGAALAPNWLPAPAGTFQRMLRMYRPDERAFSILAGSWRMPAVRKVA